MAEGDDERCRECGAALTVIPGFGVYAPLGLCAWCRMRARRTRRLARGVVAMAWRRRFPAAWRL